MSHQPERRDKTCLNCEAQVQGRFCHRCGQENIVTRQSALSLAKHFVFDIFHFDGKFFDTLAQLLFHPGRVPKAYVEGKRARYLDPIRMYLFTSAIFFLIFFASGKGEAGEIEVAGRPLSAQDRLAVAMDLKARQKVGAISEMEQRALEDLLDSSLRVYLKDPVLLKKDSLLRYKGKAYHYSTQKRPALQVFDSTTQKENWLAQQVARKVVTVERKYTENPNALQEVFDKAVHRVPYLLFVSLPFFALILQLLYRRQSQFYYSDHAIFTLYHYIFTFLLLLALFGVEQLHDWLGWGILGWMQVSLVLWWGYYLYKGLSTFYGQSRQKTVVKFLALNVLGTFIALVLLLLFILFTAYQI